MLQQSLTLTRAGAIEDDEESDTATTTLPSGTAAALTIQQTETKHAVVRNSAGLGKKVDIGALGGGAPGTRRTCQCLHDKHQDAARLMDD